MDRITALKELAELKAQGVLTDAEFEVEKTRILGPEEIPHTPLPGCSPVEER